MSVCLVHSQTIAYTSRPRMQGLMHRAVCLLTLAFTSSHCSNPRRDGHAKLDWMANYMPLVSSSATVTRPNINRALISLDFRLYPLFSDSWPHQMPKWEVFFRHGVYEICDIACATIQVIGRTISSSV